MGRYFWRTGRGDVKFDTGSVKHTSVVGLEVSNERIGIDRYTWLSRKHLAGRPRQRRLGEPVALCAELHVPPIPDPPSLIGIRSAIMSTARPSTSWTLPTGRTPSF